MSISKLLESMIDKENFKREDKTEKVMREIHSMLKGVKKSPVRIDTAKIHADDGYEYGTGRKIKN